MLQIQKLTDKISILQLKVITGFSLLCFLISVLSVTSFLLLALTAILSYATMSRMIEKVILKGPKHYLPEKWQRRIGDKSIGEYFCDMRTFESVPVLNVIIKTMFSSEKQYDHGPMSSVYQQRNHLTSKDSRVINKIKNTAGDQDDPRFKNDQQQQKRIKEAAEAAQAALVLVAADRLTKMKKSTDQKYLNDVGDKMQGKSFLNTTATEESSPIIQASHQKRSASPKVKRNNSFMLKRRFIEQSSSIQDGSEKNFNNSNKTVIKREKSPGSLSIDQHQQQKMKLSHSYSSSRSQLIPMNSANYMSPYTPHPLKTFEEYIKALMWMMKKLLGLRKTTSKIKRTSTFSIVVITVTFWGMIALQIKIGSKRGRMLIKCLQVIGSILSIIGASAATSALVYKMYRQIYPLPPRYVERKEYPLQRAQPQQIKNQ